MSRVGMPPTLKSTGATGPWKSLITDHVACVNFAFTAPEAAKAPAIA